jgi:integrase
MTIVNHTGSKYLYYSFQLEQRKYFKSTKTTNKALARQIEAQAYQQAVKDLKLGRESPETTLGQAMEGFLASKVGTPYHSVLINCQNPLKGSKRCNKTKKQVKVYGLDFAMPLQHLKSYDLNRLVDARKKEGSAQATIKQHVCAIAGAWRWAKAMGFLVDDSMTFPSFKRQVKEIVFLEPEEEQRLIDSLDPTRDVHGYGKYETRNEFRQQRLQDQHDFVVGLLDLGCRFSELASLKWTDIDLSKGQAYIYQIKTKKAHTVFLTERFTAVLAKRAEEKSHEMYVFPNDDRDGPRTFHNMWFNRAVKRAGIDKKITHHKLRTTFATNLAKNNVSLGNIKVMLGHSSIEQVLAYAAFQPDTASREAVDVLNALHEKARKVSAQA